MQAVFDGQMTYALAVQNDHAPCYISPPVTPAIIAIAIAATICAFVSFSVDIRPTLALAALPAQAKFRAAELAASSSAESRASQLADLKQQLASTQAEAQRCRQRIPLVPLMHASARSCLCLPAVIVMGSNNTLVPTFLSFLFPSPAADFCHSQAVRPAGGNQRSGRRAGAAQGAQRAARAAATVGRGTRAAQARGGRGGRRRRGAQQPAGPGVVRVRVAVGRQGPTGADQEPQLAAPRAVQARQLQR